MQICEDFFLWFSEVVGWLKESISEVSIPDGKINLGCLTDCEKYRLEVRLNDLGSMKHLVEGSHVWAIGTIKYAGAIPYLSVDYKEYIKLQSNDVKTWRQLRVGTDLLKRTNNDKDEKNVSFFFYSFNFWFFI